MEIAPENTESTGIAYRRASVAGNKQSGFLSVTVRKSPLLSVKPPCSVRHTDRAPALTHVGPESPTKSPGEAQDTPSQSEQSHFFATQKKFMQKEKILTGK